MADLRRIVLRIRRDNPAAAARVGNKIYTELESLTTMPFRGRLGPRPGTQELVIAGTPYIGLYEVVADTVHLLAIYHGAQDRPRL